MVLVTLVAGLTVYIDCREGIAVDSHLQIASALILVIVILLQDACNTESLWNWENTNMFLFFMGLVLTSVPQSLSSIIWEFVRVILMIFALVSPIFNC